MDNLERGSGVPIAPFYAGAVAAFAVAAAELAIWLAPDESSSDTFWLVRDFVGGIQG